MTRDIRTLGSRARLAYGLGCITLGCYPIALSLGYIPIVEADIMAPRWVVAAAGFTFVIAGFMILLAHHSRANDLLAGFLLLLFGAIGTWVSLFSAAEGFSGGLPFLSREQNVFVARCVFGLGALISIATCAYAFRRATRDKSER